jgi:hypothetical protein
MEKILSYPGPDQWNVVSGAYTWKSYTDFSFQPREWVISETCTSLSIANAADPNVFVNLHQLFLQCNGGIRTGRVSVVILPDSIPIRGNESLDELLQHPYSCLLVSLSATILEQLQSNETQPLFTKIPLLELSCIPTHLALCHSQVVVHISDLSDPISVFGFLLYATDADDIARMRTAPREVLMKRYIEVEIDAKFDEHGSMILPSSFAGTPLITCLVHSTIPLESVVARDSRNQGFDVPLLRRQDHPTCFWPSRTLLCPHQLFVLSSLFPSEPLPGQTNPQGLGHKIQSIKVQREKNYVFPALQVTPDKITITYIFYDILFYLPTQYPHVTLLTYQQEKSAKNESPTIHYWMPNLGPLAPVHQANVTMEVKKEKRDEEMVVVKKKTKQVDEKKNVLSSPTSQNFLLGVWFGSVSLLIWFTFTYKPTCR